MPSTIPAVPEALPDPEGLAPTRPENTMVPAGRNRSRRWRLAAVATLAAGAVLVAACGDDSVATGSGSDASTDLADEVDDVTSEAEDVAREAQDVAENVDRSDVEAGAADLAAVLRENGMTTLASAVEQVDIDQLIGDEEYTLLGPNDEAFLEMDADQTADLLSDPDRLLTVLRNHVVPGKVPAADLADGDTVTTEAGNDLPTTVDGDTVTIGGATVVEADVEAGPAVVHVIDQVLIP